MSMLTLDDVYLDNDAFRDRVPHEVFTLLRHEAPVYWYDWEHGKGFWCITRYDDVVSVLKDWRTYSSETGATALEDLDPDQIEARKSMLDTGSVLPIPTSAACTRGARRARSTGSTRSAAPTPWSCSTTATRSPSSAARIRRTTSSRSS
jgi:hypothetical protein